MKNIYHRDIMELLLSQGTEGMCLKQLARIIYNRHVELFCTDLSYDKIYKTIRFYLWTQAQRPSSPFTKGLKRGTYKIKNSFGVQMDIRFEEPKPKTEEPQEKSEKFIYPTLF